MLALSLLWTGAATSPSVVSRFCMQHFRQWSEWSGKFDICQVFCLNIPNYLVYGKMPYTSFSNSGNQSLPSPLTEEELDRKTEIREILNNGLIRRSSKILVSLVDHCENQHTAITRSIGYVLQSWVRISHTFPP